MGNENYIQNPELQNEQMKDENEVFNSFINVMVQIVEKIRKDSFARIGLCCVSYAALHITFPYKIMEVVR